MPRTHGLTNMETMSIISCCQSAHCNANYPRNKARSVFNGDANFALRFLNPSLALTTIDIEGALNWAPFEDVSNGRQRQTRCGETSLLHRSCDSRGNQTATRVHAPGYREIWFPCEPSCRVQGTQASGVGGSYGLHTRVCCRRWEVEMVPSLSPTQRLFPPFHMFASSLEAHSWRMGICWGVHCNKPSH
jgi:hypothetical protein